jgi:fructose-1-phosphate kinase PfkB-like protein
LPQGIPVDFYARLIRDLGRASVRCFLDADDDALRVGIEARPYGIKPNENELARLAGRELHDEVQILEAARDVVASGVEIVAVTLGGEGALVVTTSEHVRVRPPAVEVLSKVGAGDASSRGSFSLCREVSRSRKRAVSESRREPPR